MIIQTYVVTHPLFPPSASHASATACPLILPHPPSLFGEPTLVTSPALSSPPPHDPRLRPPSAPVYPIPSTPSSAALLRSELIVP
ncbi:hypothetical protein FA13DRAFT_1727276 [Coprinellus micaceus]|uniref:Uncharacterized protein n=1 Tax=Coprinellus micaceus TaxID=71717 RepID=A0A4Y7TSM8_COPMI|nr:hypothetical protein FA13DRAFT_1727276 [Coprinellus micaceus]